MQDEQQGNQSRITPLFSKDTVDVNSFILFEAQKNELWMGLDSMNPLNRVEKLTNLFGLMFSKMLKLVDGDVEKIKEIKYQSALGKDFSFIDAKRALPEAVDLETAREILEIGWTCYDRCISRYGGMGIVRSREGPTKKLVSRLLGPAMQDEEDIEILYAEVMKAFKDSNAPKTMLNLFSFCLFILPNFDLDMVNLLIGRRRSGKSTLFLQIVRRITAFRLGHVNLSWNKRLAEADGELVRIKFCERYVFYSDIASFSDAVKLIREEIVCGDDFVLMGDKRQGMKDPQVVLTQAIQSCADANNNLFLLAQNLALIDQRYVDAATDITANIGRGEALLFVPQMTVGILSETTGFEVFKKHPNMLKGSRKKVKGAMKNVPSYCATLKWNELGNKKLWEKTGESGNILYNSYLEAKRKSRKKKAQETAPHATNEF